MIDPRPFHLNGREILAQLNRIARTLRERSIRTSDGPAKSLALEAAREIEDMVYDAAQPRTPEPQPLIEILRELPAHRDWRRRFEAEVAVNPDALYDWWYRGFSDRQATG